MWFYFNSFSLSYARARAHTEDDRIIGQNVIYDFIMLTYYIILYYITIIILLY